MDQRDIEEAAAPVPFPVSRYDGNSTLLECERNLVEFAKKDFRSQRRLEPGVCIPTEPPLTPRDSLHAIP